VRRLRVQLTVLLALLGLLVLGWGAAVFLGARDAARTSASLQSTVDRVDELRRAATRLSRDLVTMETSRRAYLVTGDEAARRATGGPSWRPGATGPGRTRWSPPAAPPTAGSGLCGPARRPWRTA
jgi:hypothetical protein